MRRRNCNKARNSTASMFGEFTAYALGAAVLGALWFKSVMPLVVVAVGVITLLGYVNSLN